MFPSSPLTAPAATRLWLVERDGNPLRHHGHVSPFIGKLAPVCARRLDEIGQLARASLPDLPEPTLVIGMTESSLLLAFFMARWQQKPVDLRFTTRKNRQTQSEKITFREPHSHGPEHFLALDANRKYAQIVIIEDELTTGATLANLIRALGEVSDRVWVATLRDLRPQPLRDELQNEMARAGMHLEVLSLENLDERADWVVDEAPVAPHFNPFNRTEAALGGALEQLHFEFEDFAPDGIFMIGECVDIALRFWLKLPESARPPLRQITRSPWRIDGEHVRSVAKFPPLPAARIIFSTTSSRIKRDARCGFAKIPTPSLARRRANFSRTLASKRRGIVVGRMIETPWPNLQIIASDCGEIDPYAPQNASMFRGEEAFEADVTGRARWSKPSPEPRLDLEFERVLLGSIDQNAAQISALAHELARRVAAFYDSGEKPVLVAILRAGVPVAALLSRILEKQWNQTVPIRAFSLFYGLGWDDAALDEIVAEFPHRPLLFVDGWTSGGNVAIELNRAFDGWKSAGKPDFARGEKPKLAVLCDPRGRADFARFAPMCGCRRRVSPRPKRSVFHADSRAAKAKCSAFTVFRARS
jgi:adenine/guanine phosphoribosyltransferase-like PRPP-binding protein